MYSSIPTKHVYNLPFTQTQPQTLAPECADAAAPSSLRDRTRTVCLILHCRRALNAPRGSVTARWSGVTVGGVRGDRAWQGVTERGAQETERSWLQQMSPEYCSDHVCGQTI
uniref:Uncharacterized protein n=1 Tax=Knipowitschia caucasica TaxID=637954 RepID=A0AAV2LUZ9_KNICA